MSAQRLGQPRAQLFDPSSEELQGSFKNVPRYLFRLYGPTTAGKSTEFEVTSPAWATPQKDPTCRHGLFQRTYDDARSLIYDHLRWGDGEHEATCNLMSWTSSILFAILYGIYRGNHSRVNHTQVLSEDLQILVVNTGLLPHGAFIRDLDLIDFFAPHTSQQNQLRGWRTRSDRRLYFGEYLSQGILNIEGRCTQTSLKALIDNGVFRLCPGMEDRNFWDKWANRTVDLREPFQSGLSPVLTSKRQLRTALVIAEGCFGSVWTLPMLLALLSLRPRHIHDDVIVQGIFALFSGESGYVS